MERETGRGGRGRVRGPRRRGQRHQPGEVLVDGLREDEGVELRSEAPELGDGWDRPRAGLDPLEAAAGRVVAAADAGADPLLAERA